MIQPTSHLSRISSATWMINLEKNHNKLNVETHPLSSIDLDLDGWKPSGECYDCLTLTNIPQTIPQGIPFHAEMSHEIKPAGYFPLNPGCLI